MGIEQELTTRLKDAMRAKKTEEVSVIRMVKAAATKEKTSSGFSGEIDDNFWLGVIGRYVKQQTRAIAEFEKVSGGAEQIKSLKFEIDYLTPFLPAGMSPEETEKLVDAAIAATGADSMKFMGKIMGYIMKDNKDTVDAGLVKQLIQKKLS